jgi:hypothetical protein
MQEESPSCAIDRDRGGRRAAIVSNEKDQRGQGSRRRAPKRGARERREESTASAWRERTPSRRGKVESRRMERSARRQEQERP